MTRRSTLFSKEENHETVSGLVLSISQPCGRSLNTGEIALGQYDTEEGRWMFECNDPAIARWLQVTFSQPVNVIGGQLAIDSFDFVTHIRDAVMHRKGLTLEIKQKTKE